MATDTGRHLRAECGDCGHDTRMMHELYMIQHDLWERVMDGDGWWCTMLCVGCLEARLGRELRRIDFIDCPLNWSDKFPHSMRLRRRMGSL